MSSTISSRLAGTVPVGDLYAHTLASAYHNEFRLIDPDISEQKEPGIWNLIQRDSVVAQAVLQRTAVVAASNYQIEAATKDEPDVLLADYVREMLAGIRKLQEARANLAKGVFRGRAYLFMKGRRRLHRFEHSTETRNWWLPYRLQHVDKHRVQYVPEKVNGKITTRVELFSIERRKYERVQLAGNFVSVTYGEEESRLGYGRGLVETLYFLWWARMRLIKEGLQAVERWAQGFLLGKVDTNTADGATPKKQLQNMRDMLVKNRARHIAVVRAGDSVELVTGGANEHQLIEFWINLIDSKIMGAAMGAVLPFGLSEDVGSLARGLVEQEVAEERTTYDRSVCDESITHDLIATWLRRNRAQLEAEGLGSARTPIFKTLSPEKNDPNENVDRYNKILERAPVKSEEYYAAVGAEMPEDAPDVIEPVVQQTAVPGGATFDTVTREPIGVGPSSAGAGSSAAPLVGSDESEEQSLSPTPASTEDVPVDVGEVSAEEQVQSELLGKVGGITGAIEIMKNLRDDTITRETAVQMFMLFFGLEKHQANALIGQSGEAPLQDNEHAPTSTVETPGAGSTS